MQYNAAPATFAFLRRAVPLPQTIMLRRFFSQPIVFLLWLLHFLPFPLLAMLGRRFGDVLLLVARHRREVAAINLRWCFPEKDETQRQQMLKAHFHALGRSLLERSLLWWGSQERLNRLIHIAGEEKIRDLLKAQRPVILLAPHFVGLDAGGVAITTRFDIVSIYAAQASPVFNRLLLRGRSRFGNQLLLSRQDGARATVKAMKAGRPFYYLPDLNARRRDSIFVPFFGIQTATITGLSRLARAANAVVLPCTTRMLPGGEGYVVEIGDAWKNFPSDNVEADTARMNRWIEAAIRTMPEQYYWVHRRFKTRPVGEKKPY